jgi:hypothetical protein
MENLKEKTKEFASLVQKDTLDDLNTRYPMNLESLPNFWENDAETKVIFGQKYIKVDVGRSGKFMIEKETGNIFGIKGYGVIHRGKRYGNLDNFEQFHWGRYGGPSKRS